MSLKAEIETWVEALKAYDNQDFETALDMFQRIADSSKILTNIGLIYATMGDHELAVENFNAATGLDQFLAVAYFQCGVSNFLMNRHDLAYKDFEEAYLYLRGNQSIKYEQLGLKFTLYSAEVLFNRGLSQIYMNRIEEGMADLREASREKVTGDHDVIEDAIRVQGETYTVFSIPVGILYRPSENKVKNTKAKDYLGKAKLVAASDPRDMYTTFTGSTRLAQGMTPSGAPLDRPPEDDRRPSVALMDDRRPSNSSSDNSSRRPSEMSVSSLERSATMRTMNQDRTPGFPSRSASASSGEITRVARANSLAAMGTGNGNLPSRSLSARAGSVSSAGAAPERRTLEDRAPPLPTKGPRLTELYDEYGGFDDRGPGPKDTSPGVASWVQKNQMSGNGGLSRRPSAAPSVMSGGSSLRRKSTRRITTMSRANSRRGTQWGDDEEEEGYVSGDFEDFMFELTRIRVKIHYRDDVRGMAISPEIPYDEFLERVTSKFGRKLNGLAMKFKDEEGGLVSLMDDSDFELAIETARESAKGKPEGKLEIWCEDG